MPHLPGLLQPEPLSLQQANADLCLHRRHSDTQRQVWLSLLWGPWILVHTRFCLSSPSISCGYGGYKITPPTIFGAPSFAFGHRVSSFGGIQHSSVNGCSAVSCNFGVLTGEDKCTSFYSPHLWIRWAQTDCNYQMKSHTFFLCMNYVHFPPASFLSSVLGSVGG